MAMVTLLIVDDNEQNLYMLQVLLQGHGYKVVAARDGAEALEKARRGPPDVIIADILMPVMDGFTLCREWKKDPQLQGIPFVFYTATYTDPKDEEFALNLGAERFIVKPVEPDVFVKMLQEVIAEHEAGVLAVPRESVEEEVVFQQYSERLVKKLEDKMVQLEKANRRLAALHQASVALASIVDLSALMGHGLDVVIEAMGYARANLFVYDDATETFRLAGAAGFSEEMLEAFRRELVFRLGDKRGLVGLVGQSGQALIVEDVTSDSRWIPVDETLRSALFVPVVHEQRVMGVIVFVSTEVGAFDEEDAQSAMTLAGSVAIAVENARLYEQIRRHAEELEERVRERTVQVQAQYARLDVILRSTSDGIVVTDEQGEVLQANPVAQTWLTQTFSADDAARLREAVRDLARRAKERPEKVLELTGLDLQLSAAPILELGMEGAAAVVAVHDVGYLKELDRLKSRFVSNVSHELRTPITTIKLYAALLRKASLQKREEYLDMLEQEADLQARLVEDILQISRIEAGRLEAKLEPTALNDLTAAAVEGHQGLAENRGLALEHRPAEPGPVALVDPKQMMQVLTNLVVNAIQYTPERGRVVVSTGKKEAEGCAWATATVADTGMGILEGELPHIFERFFRGEKPQQMQVPGTGLGLAIVKEIMELHGGQVTVESRVEDGTIFTIWLPLVDEGR
ncbi:MAG: response regulator [Chloroflexota bacterium]|nr:response regulator [Chloroflexota bacterium]